MQVENGLSNYNNKKRMYYGETIVPRINYQTRDPRRKQLVQNADYVFWITSIGLDPHHKMRFE
jgi:hypothetical protein